MAGMQKEEMRMEHIDAKMKNQTPSTVHCERYMKWSMPDDGTSPPPIEARGLASFTGFVSKGAVIYASHSNQSCPTAWLVAWERPDKYYFLPPCQNKRRTGHGCHRHRSWGRRRRRVQVYVACGRKSVIEKMSDGEIKKKLDDACTTEDTVTDPITKATVSANLREVFGVELAPIDTALDACFGVSL